MRAKLIGRHLRNRRVMRSYWLRHVPFMRTAEFARMGALVITEQRPSAATNGQEYSRVSTLERLNESEPERSTWH